MSDLTPLIATKLARPPLRLRLVARPRLSARLNEWRSRPLLLISAPPGFGKTTLLASWLADQPASAIGWLALDADDNDPVRFFTYMVAATQRALPTLGATARELLQSAPPPPLQTILATLINDMSTLTAPLLLVLDDYHLITTHAIHAALAFLLEHLPPQVHLAILTRADPPLPLARMRARDQLAELRADDLRFTAAEVEPFLSDVMGVALASAEVAALEARTEGWAAALQLAALALRGRNDATVLLAGLGGQRFLADYLLDEVLNHQPPAIQHFLLHTAILDRMCAPLCAALLADVAPEQLQEPAASPSQDILETLERANLFVVALDGEARWYRYHQLFAEFLRSRLGARAAPLHARAAHWYAQQGFADEAVHHALTAQEYEYAARIVEAQATTLALRGRVQTLGSWLTALPTELRRTRPGLLTAQASLAVSIGDYAAAEPLLDAAATLPDPEQIWQLPIATVRTIVLSITADPRAFPLAQQVLHALPAEAYNLRAAITLSLGIAAGYTGDLRAAERLHREAIAAARTDDTMRSSLVAALAGLAIIRRWQGRVRDAEQQSMAARELALRDNQLLPVVGTILADMEYAVELHERGGHTEAIQILEQAIARSRAWGSTDFTEIYAPLCLSLVLLSAGRGAAALAQIEAIAEAAPHHLVPPLRLDEIAAYRALIELRLGRLEAAARWADAQDTRLEHPISMYNPAPLLLARIRLAQGRIDEARLRIARVLAAAEEGGYGLIVLEALVLEALAAQAQHQPAAAHAALARAQALAAPEGIVRVFTDEGAALAPLLGTAPDTTMPARPSGEPGTLPEPLSQRELEVLRLLNEGCSNREIAARMVIEVSTAKRHLNNIYAKLGVNSRTQALAQARSHKLL